MSFGHGHRILVLRCFQGRNQGGGQCAPLAVANKTFFREMWPLSKNGRLIPMSFFSYHVAPRGPATVEAETTVCDYQHGPKALHGFVGPYYLQDLASNSGPPNAQKIPNLWATNPGEAPRLSFENVFYFFLL